MAEIEPLAAEQGLELFDLDLPDRQTGTVRVSVRRPPGKGAVTVDDCAALSRRLSAHARLGEWLGQFTLEVSSPGVNRRLQRPEHFVGAVGERVQITLKQGPLRGQVLVGKLTACDGREVVLELEGTGSHARCGLDQIAKARVDYLFV